MQYQWESNSVPGKERYKKTVTAKVFQLSRESNPGHFDLELTALNARPERLLICLSLQEQYILILIANKFNFNLNV